MVAYVTGIGAVTVVHSNGASFYCDRVSWKGDARLRNERPLSVCVLIFGNVTPDLLMVSWPFAALFLRKIISLSLF